MTNLPTFQATVFIAGNLTKVEDVCRKFCLRGCCVTITQTTFVFTGGAETGVAVGFINYPRFPSSPDAIRALSTELAKLLMSELGQRSCTVLCSDTTEFLQNPDIAVPR